MTTVDGMLEAISEDLVSTGLLMPSQLFTLRTHAAGFPAAARHRLFLEYRVGEELVLEGYGHGYGPSTLTTLLESSMPFEAAGPVRTALAQDPFALDRHRYLDPGADTDPTWIEYDVVDDRISEAPGVFFAFPARFRHPVDDDGISALEARMGSFLGGSGREPGGRGIWDLLKRLVDHETAAGRALGLYRLGLCTGRPPGWVRLVMSDLARDSLVPLDGQGVLASGPDPIGWVVDAVSMGGGPAPVQIAASVTAVAGVVQAVDIECPFFHRIGDRAERRRSAGTFCALLLSRGLLSEAAAGVLTRAAVLSTGPAEAGGQLLLNHFKFGVAGNTRGRVKVYFELLLRTDG